MLDLKLCPKCGGKASYEPYGSYGMDAFKVDYVFCTVCKFKVGWAESKDCDAVALWNSLKSDTGKSRDKLISRKRKQVKKAYLRSGVRKLELE